MADPHHITSSLAKALQNNSSMEKITTCSFAGTEVALALSLTLQSNKTLKRLWLWYDRSIRKAGARALVNALQYNNMHSGTATTSSGLIHACHSLQKNWTHE